MHPPCTKQQSGFTIIELSLAMLILGVLSVMAFSFYKDNSVRTKVVELFSVMSTAKSNISEYVLIHQAMPSSMSEAGVQELKSDYLKNFLLKKGAD